MGSMSNPNSWASYDSYSDCSQGLCSIYCPQWCYFIIPPPPPFFFNDSSSSSFNSSPLLIALIGILASAFILVSYYTIVSKYCHRRRETSSFSSATESRREILSAAAGDGLNDSLIKSITVYKYRKENGFIDGSDCSVCLSEFEENESLRLLPKCNHAFHLPCIDTWLKSHSNCPLCRAFVTGINPTTEANSVANQSNQITMESGNRGRETEESNSSMANFNHQSEGSFEDLEIGSWNTNDRSQPTPPEEQRDTKYKKLQPNWRSVSLNSSTLVSIVDDKGDEESAGVGTSRQRQEEGEDEHGNKKRPPVTEAETAENNRSGVSNFWVRSSVAMKRSVSTGRFIF